MESKFPRVIFNHIPLKIYKIFSSFFVTVLKEVEGIYLLMPKINFKLWTKLSLLSIKTSHDTKKDMSLLCFLFINSVRV